MGFSYPRRPRPRSTLAVTLLGIETVASADALALDSMFHFGCNPFRD